MLRSYKLPSGFLPTPRVLNTSVVSKYLPI